MSDKTNLMAKHNIKIRFTKGRLIALVVVVAAIAVALYFIFRKQPQPEVIPTVTVETVQTEDMEIYGEYVGRIRAQQFVEIRARVEGYLEEMLFEEGTYIQKDQVLFIIDPKLYRARVDKAYAQLQKDRGSLDHGVREGVVVDAALQQVLHGNHDLTDVFGGLVDGNGNVLLGGDSRIVDHEMLA